MRMIAGLVLLAFACFGPVHGQEKKAAAASVSDTLKQMEHDWLDAMKAVDIDKLSPMIADDWAGLGPDGVKQTKQGYLDDVKSGKSKIESFEFGPMSVKVIGSVGIVQGSDTEKSTYKGKDSSGKWVWMDVFAKRDGKWQVVRSQTAKIK